MISSLQAQVVSSLTELIGNTQGDTLPSMGALAKQLRVSVATTAAAARELRSRGILQFSRGTPMRIAGRAVAAAAIRSSAASRVREDLQSKLLNNDLPYGTVMPKVAELVREYRVSEHTVQRAMRLLEQDNLAHRVSRKWIAGQRPPTVSSAVRKTVLLLARSTSVWRAMHLSERYLPFCRAVDAELEMRGLQTTAVLAQVRPPAVYEAAAAGRLEVAKLIAKLGSRCVGALMVGSEKDLGNVAQWVDIFVMNGRPVVWLDTAPDMARTEYPRNHLFTRCYCSEADLVETAVRALADAGHRTCAYLSRSNGDSWRALRTKLVIETCERHGIDVYIPDQADGAGTDLDYAANAALANAPLSSRNSIERHQRHVRSYMPGTARQVFLSIARPEVSAILAANDSDARIIRTFLRILDIEVPAQMSLLSFDNSPMIFPYEISSISPGLGYLGASAVRILLGEQCAQRVNSELPATPIVKDRGSVGFARDPDKVPRRVGRGGAGTRAP